MTPDAFRALCASARAFLLAHPRLVRDADADALEAAVANALTIDAADAAAVLEEVLAATEARMKTFSTDLAARARAWCDARAALLDTATDAEPLAMQMAADLRLPLDDAADALACELRARTAQMRADRAQGYVAGLAAEARLRRSRGAH